MAFVMKLVGTCISGNFLLMTHFLLQIYLFAKNVKMLKYLIQIDNMRNRLVIE